MIRPVLWILNLKSPRNCCMKILIRLMDIQVSSFRQGSMEVNLEAL